MKIVRQPGARRGRTAFTLVEAMVALSITSLLFLGAVTLFITALQTTARVNADAASSGDAANTMRHVMDDLREASYFALPDDSGAIQGTNRSKFVYPAAYSWSSFTTTVSGSAIDTGLMLVSPGLQPATPVSVISNTGATLTVSPTPYNRDPTVGAAYSTTLNYIYRANKDGTPNSAAGQYVAWASANSTGGAFTVSRTVEISDLASGAAPNAVQFLRMTDAAGNPQKYAMEMKVVSSYYTPGVNRQSSEETNGSSVSQMTGKCVQMRDHELGADYESTSGSGTASSSKWIPD